MLDKKIINWGIIGAGDVAEVKSGPGFYKASNSKLLAVMRRNGDKARDFAERHQVPLWYDNAEALLANPDLDAIYIATPPAQHKDYAIAALAAGKNVYIEKPVTLNAQECIDIISARDRSTNKVCVAHYRRFLPSFLKIAGLLNSGAIGKPLLARLDMLRPASAKLIATSNENWRVDPAVSGGGLFYDLSPHQLDLMLHWFGRVTHASGFSTNQVKHYGVDDCVMGWARFSSGVELQGRWHFAMPENAKRDECEIVGSEGRLTFNFFDQTVIKLFREDGEEAFSLPNPSHIQQPMIEMVNTYFRGEGENPSSLEEALDVMGLIDTFTSPSPISANHSNDLF